MRRVGVFFICLGFTALAYAEPVGFNLTVIDVANEEEVAPECVGIESAQWQAMQETPAKAEVPLEREDNSHRRSILNMGAMSETLNRSVNNRPKTSLEAEQLGWKRKSVSAVIQPVSAMVKEVPRELKGKRDKFFKTKTNYLSNNTTGE